MRSWVITVFLAAILGSVRPAAAEPIALTVQPITINNSAGQQVDPHVDGDIAVYTDFSAGAQIRYYDFRTGVDAAIPAGGNRDQLSDVSAGRVVFTRIYSDGSEAVMIFDTSTAAGAVEVNPGAGTLRSAVAIGANTIAYVDHLLSADYTGEIVVWDAANGTATRLTFDGNIDQAPAVSPDGNVVVWERCSPTSLSNCDVAMAVQSGGGWTVSDVAATPAPEGFPDTNGTDVVWTAHNGTDYDIYRRAVAGGAVQQLALPGDQVHPSIAGDVIAFEGISGGATDLFVHHLADGALYQLTATPGVQESLNDVTVLSDGSVRLVWQANDGADGMNDVHGATFTLPHNAAPVACAPNQTVHVGGVVTLDASCSYDPDQDYPLRYAWDQVSYPPGSAVANADLNIDSATVSFTADLPGEYVILLVVYDSTGRASDPIYVTVSTTNTAPVADAGPDQAVVQLGTTVQLDGTTSWDDDGDPLSYAWTMASKPAGSQAGLSDPASATPNFVADVQGVYEVVLVVNDGWSDSAPDTVVVSFQNVKPVADAGGNQSVSVGDTVVLNGAASGDANGDPLTYGWRFVSLPSGSAVALSNASSALANFTSDVAGTYIVSLVVNDGFVDSDPSNATITATASGRPYDAAVGKLQDALDAVNGLADASFRNANLRNALTNKINAAIAMVEAGDYADALNKLENDIAPKADGCARSGSPDRNDWVQDCPSQDRIYRLIQEAIALIRALMGP